jgi:hypothetical protein
MKKICVSILLLSTVLGLNYGCGSNDPSDDVKEPASAKSDPNNPNVQNPLSVEGDGIARPGGKTKGGP